MSPEEVFQRYMTFHYAIRYLPPGMDPSDHVEEGTVFALETGPESLALDPRGRPLLFSTEAEAFRWRYIGGCPGPVLVFGPEANYRGGETLFDIQDIEQDVDPWN